MKFPECADLLASLPDRLDRQTVRTACRAAAEESAAALQAFVVVMVWGHGKVDMGPGVPLESSRTPPQALDRLAKVARTLADRGALAAYDFIAGNSRLRWLGPAFGTKYLYFCPQGAGPPALILDRLVAHWLSSNVGISFNAGPWSSSTYRRYLDLLGSWAAALGVAPDEVERCIFQAQANQRRNQWAIPPTASSSQGTRGPAPNIGDSLSIVTAPREVQRPA